MRRAQRRLAWLLLGVAVLAALALWQWRSAQADATLLPLDPAAVTRVEVQRAGQPARHFVKRDGHWYHAGTSHARADDAHVAALAALARTPVLQWRMTSDVDLAKIGLAAPPVVVRLDGHTLAYGALAAFGPQRFVRVGPRVAVVGARYSPPSPPSSSQKP